MNQTKVTTGFTLPGRFELATKQSCLKLTSPTADSDRRDESMLLEPERERPMHRTILSMKDAIRLHPEVIEAEKALTEGRNLNSHKIFSQAPKSFRWMHHFSANHMCMPIVDGDVSSVYPGTTNEDIQKDVHCVAKYFDSHMHDELAEFLARTLAGEPSRRDDEDSDDDDKDGKSVFVWHSLPEYSFIVQIEFHKTVRYLNSRGELMCMQIGETRDVTRAMKEHEELVSGIISRHRESIDHRFGNKIRMMHLLCQNSSMDELSAHFERLTYEIEIRRNMFSNLPEIEPVVFQDLIKEEFIKVDIHGLTRQRLLFFDFHGRPLSPVVVQVLLLQDIASNVFKHGDGTVVCAVNNRRLLISNNIGRKASSDESKCETLQNKSPRKRIGLDTLKTVCKSIDVGVEFEKCHNRFVTTLKFGEIVIMPPELREEDRAPTPPPSTNCLAEDIRTTALNYTWVILEDEPIICHLYQHLASKKFSIDLHVVQSPSDVANAGKIVVDIHRQHRKPVILIMDEMLYEMGDDFETRTVTGTQIRDKLMKSKTHSNLIQQGNLILVSSSASDVQDDRVLVKVGKTGTIAADISRIVELLGSAGCHQSSTCY